MRRLSPFYLCPARPRRRQERSSLREGTTPPLRRSLRAFRVLRISGIKTPAPLPQSSPPQAPETTASAPFFESSVGKCSGAQSATTQSRCATRTTSPAFSVSAVRASCRLRQLRCWVVPCRDSSSSAGSVRRVPSLHSSVSLRLGYTRPLFLHTSAGVNPARSVPGSREAAVPAAGADSDGTSPPQTAPEPQCQAAYAAANVVPLFGQVSRPGSVR